MNYWGLFKLGLFVLLALLAAEWLPAFRDVLPSGRHSPEYNRAAFAMIAMGAWGLMRMFNQRRGQ